MNIAAAIISALSFAATLAAQLNNDPHEKGFGSLRGQTLATPQLVMLAGFAASAVSEVLELWPALRDATDPRQRAEIVLRGAAEIAHKVTTDPTIQGFGWNASERPCTAEDVLWAILSGRLGDVARYEPPPSPSDTTPAP